MEGIASLFFTLAVFYLVESKFTTDTTIDRYDDRGRSNHTLDANNNIPDVRYRRCSGLNCFGSLGRNRKGYTRNQRRRYIRLLNNNIRPADIRTCAESYYNRNQNELSKAPRIVQNKLKELGTKVERAELLATHLYTVESAMVNLILQNILEDRPFANASWVRKDLSEHVDETFCQSVLIQRYIQKKSLEHPKTVYRFERKFMERLYKDEVYTTQRFLSTTENNIRLSDAGIDLSDPVLYPIELTIDLKRSGAYIADISKIPEQKEWLVPIGAQFNVMTENITIEGNSIIKVNLTEI